MAASETFKILRAAVRLGEFTQPELATISGASYEMVKKVLRAERAARTVEQLDRTVGGTKGRPRFVWRVIDQDAIEARLDAIRREAEGVTETLSTAGEVSLMYSLLDAALTAAEDRLVFALKVGDPGDAACFAREALAEIAPHEGDLAADDGGGPGGRKRNVRTPAGRAEVIRAMAAYIVGDEALGVDGPLWRRAYDTLRSFDHAPQAGLHKLFLTALIDVADRRARSGPAAAPFAGVGVALGAGGFEMVLRGVDGHVLERRHEALPAAGGVEDVAEAMSTSVKDLLVDHPGELAALQRDDR